MNVVPRLERVIDVAHGYKSTDERDCVLLLRHHRRPRTLASRLHPGDALTHCAHRHGWAPTEGGGARRTHRRRGDVSSLADIWISGFISGSHRACFIDDGGDAESRRTLSSVLAQLRAHRRRRYGVHAVRSPHSHGRGHRDVGARLACTDEAGRSPTREHVHEHEQERTG